MDTDFKYVLKDQNALLERQAVALEKIAEILKNQSINAYGTASLQKNPR